MDIRVLVIEDDREINLLLCKALTGCGYIAVSAFTGMQGLDMIKSTPFDMVFLDLMLPYKTGDTILQELRQFSNIPVIVISAKDITQTKIDLLRLGADDYITKPFDIDEVMARAAANLRRVSANLPDAITILHYKDLSIDTNSKQVFAGETEILLTATEFKLLLTLAAHPRKVFSKANLFESIWNEAYTIDDNTLNVHISRLRHKLKESGKSAAYIETMWGLGYRMAK